MKDWIVVSMKADDPNTRKFLALIELGDLTSTNEMPTQYLGRSAAFQNNCRPARAILNAQAFRPARR